MSVGPEDAAALEAWWQQCVAHPGALPEGVAPVQVRLVRAVGRGTLPEVGRAFVKVMGFPRLRDRVRYVHRALPAEHEATMLEAVRGAGLVCPEVLLARGLRVAGLPRLSMLVTGDLGAVDGDPPAAAVVEIASRLAAAGIFHPDLHAENFLRLANGGAAVLDFQSARRRRPGLTAGLRRRMAVVLLASAPRLEGAVRAGDLVAAGGMDAVLRAAEAFHRQAQARRIRRCMERSSEFEVRRGWRGFEARRRAAAEGGEWIEGGPELVRLWIGDRALEVLDGARPTLGALFRKSWWFRGKASVYLLPAERLAVLPREALLEGFDRYRALTRD